MEKEPSSSFEEVAADKAQTNLIADFWYFLRHSKKWWLLPVISILLLLGILLLLSGTAAAPFIYTLF
jgi:hypothetical protein